MLQCVQFLSFHVPKFFCDSWTISKGWFKDYSMYLKSFKKWVNFKIRLNSITTIKFRYTKLFNNHTKCRFGEEFNNTGNNEQMETASFQLNNLMIHLYISSETICNY